MVPGATQPAGQRAAQQARLRAAIGALEAEAFAFGTRFIRDGAARAAYTRAVRETAEELLHRAQGGAMTYEAAAVEANQLRNAIMETTRARTSEIMRAYAQSLKAEGLTMESLIARHAEGLFKKAPSALSAAEREAVMARILQGAARARPEITIQARNFGRLGRGLVALSLGIAFYNIMTAEDRGRAVVREGATLGAGFAGAALGGAAAGLVCGPGAPVCSTVGVFVGGALFAFGVSWAFD
ncbi:hypothetical protein [Plastoroseomonas arctica]|uniref:Uncharacterized protein n=1 Tax=Plastoroseomonas arctica TaxID=1509237 RepID=A0AAF1KN61_9PROT|nr:hypothetical protein [Plastoroseomonas arctica]MBR0657191.1 hypothetical protein [Plastoroseomonas arctica]